MSVPQPKLPHLANRAEYRAWTAAQPRGRFERIAGEVVAMAPERIAHVRVKARLWQALDRAIQDAGLLCDALPDGVTVEVGEDTDYEPDAVVNCGAPIPGDAIAAPNPLIVAEVLSPSTRSVDSGAKLADYFRLSSVMHYLILRADRPQVIHHRRNGPSLLTEIVTTGALSLDPPGITIGIDEIYAPPMR
ncbi:Uma2 family endonuclease [Roseomonas sp. NAR14]|uniref:Uma2 family endonuclease n=1 Tax=Roseomonas acroporae TaxID=2937791 RepID=A0A9X1YFA4_9PROT|nr:Uma2 family endonuclease [Roseomonas acroporae]MCK8788060.1 Uma2 family endonuclease [Roseomonas acroporae]